MELAKPIHKDYFSHDLPIYYDNGEYQTVVKRDSLDDPGPIDRDPHYVYSSAKEMLEEEFGRRQNRGKKLKHVAYAHIPRASFKGKVQKGTESYSVRNNYFYRGSLNGKYYRGSDGKVHKVHHAITSSWDRSSPDLHMAKVLVDKKTKESICYGSRPDTLSRARKQAKDIFRTEMESHFYKGITRDPKTGEYTLTYVVDSLTNPVKIQNPTLLNERESLLSQIKALYELSQKPITIDGCVVHLKPIHVHHTLSVFGEIGKILPDSISGKDIERGINKRGYGALIQYAEKFANKLKTTDPAKQTIILDTVHFLKKSSSLSVSERLIIVDFLTQICNLPIAHHCKSIVDRTSVASSVAMLNHFIKGGRLIDKIPKEGERFAIHKLLNDENYKKAFVSFMNINHQVSLDARVGILPDGKTLVGRKELGLNLKSGIFAATGAIPFFPKEAITDSFFSTKRWTRLLIYPLMPVLYIIFCVGFILGSLPLALYFKKKTGSFQKEFFLTLLPLIYRLDVWAKIKNINFEKTFNLEARDLNGDERHLLCACKKPASKEDPRLDLIPDHLKC
jgi:hypothetical protein